MLVHVLASLALAILVYEAWAEARRRPRWPEILVLAMLVVCIAAGIWS